MLFPALIPAEVITAMAVLFLLFGVPAILFGLLMLYTGYVQYDGEQYVEELEAEAEADETVPNTDANRSEGSEHSEGFDHFENSDPPEGTDHPADSEHR